MGAGDTAGMTSEIHSELLAFRDQVYQQFNPRADALFEMLDALLALPAATAPAHMMLQPSFQRKWGSVYDALSAGRINPVGTADRLAQYPLDGGESVYAREHSNHARSLSALSFASL